MLNEFIRIPPDPPSLIPNYKQSPHTNKPPNKGQGHTNNHNPIPHQTHSRKAMQGTKKQPNRKGYTVQDKPNPKKEGNRK